MHCLCNITALLPQVRLRMITGNRVLSGLGRSLTREAAMTLALSCPPHEHLRSVESLQVCFRPSLTLTHALTQPLSSFVCVCV